MKKSILLVLLGAATSAMETKGVGYIFLSNYATAPYNQVVWDPSVPIVGNQAVMDTGVQIQIWYGEGIISDPNLLTPGVVSRIDLGAWYDPGRGHGPGGYMLISRTTSLQSLPQWDPGDVYTFQARASGNSMYGPVAGSTVLWTEQSSIFAEYRAIVADNFPTLTVNLVPEPSSFALVSLTALSLWTVRGKRVRSAGAKR